MASETPWHSLPQCVVVHILKFLSMYDRRNASLTCKHWMHCSSHPELLADYTIHCGFKFNGAKENQHIGMFGKHIKSVKIIFAYDTPSFWNVSSVVKKFTSTKECKLEKFSLKNEGPYEPSDKKMKKIFVLLNKFLFPKKLATHHFNLSVIDLNKSEICLGSDMISLLAKHHPNLQVVKLQYESYTIQPGFPQYYPVNPNSMLDLVNKCIYLKELHTHYHHINTSVIEALSKKRAVSFKLLSLIHYGAATKLLRGEIIESHTWKEFAKENPNAEVKIKACSHIQFFEPLQSILRPGIPLVSLTMYTPRASILQLLCDNYSTTLKRVTIGDDGLPDDGFETALRNLISQCVNLKEVTCKHNKYMDHD